MYCHGPVWTVNFMCNKYIIDFIGYFLIFCAMLNNAGYLFPCMGCKG